jgi:tetratricopeptide (TPR) repeat protein
MATKKKDTTDPALSKIRGSASDLEKTSEPRVFSIAEAANDAQMKLLEQGLRLFQQQRFTESREFFEQAARGPQSSVALTAKNHLVVCDRRMQAPALGLQTAEDNYNYGGECLNARDLPNACKYLEIAVSLKPQSEYMLYALAAALALSGDATGSCENLKRAIQGDPRNRNTARMDPDFSSVSRHPAFIALLHSDGF